jgi:catechol 2,3-dioxygenase-like lactoylglutathione lyase family enzyme
MKLEGVAVGGRVGALAARIDELARASARDHSGEPPGALGSAARDLRSALDDIGALLGDAVVDCLIAALPEATSAALRDVPAGRTTGQLQAILDRFFDFQRAFEGIEDVALALQLPPDHDRASHTAQTGVAVDEAAVRQVITEVNRAMQAVWPEIPDDLLLRGPHGEGRGRLTVMEHKNLVTPGGPGALTLDKLERRIAASSDAPASLAAERSLRLNQVTIPTSNLTRSIEFYRGLGLQLIVRDDSSGYARLLMPDDGATFSLHVAGSRISRSDVVVYFECDDLDDRVARLCATGYAFSSMPVDQSWLWREATLEDPDGQRLCLYHAGVNRKDPPWRLVDAPWR